MVFISQLRDYQIDIVCKCLSHLRTYGGGILSVPCGRGKTIMALYLASILKVKTLVIVHKSFLQDQWIDKIKQFMPSTRIGIIRQNNINVENTDIVVGMLQSIAMKDYDQSIFKGFGLVINDECHHTASRVFSNMLHKTCATYQIGLSATPIRADGLTKVINWYIGDTMYSEKQRINKQVVAKMIYYKSCVPCFKELKAWRNKKMRIDTVKMITNLCEMTERTNHIVDIINELRNYPERKILILSERKKHLTAIKTLVDASIVKDIENEKILPDECRTYYYTGDSKKAERVEAEQHGDILFATYALAHEGLDIERLNTIILTTPKKNIIQSVGRIMRKILQVGDVRPLIIDVSDRLSAFISQTKIREKEYKKNKYKIEKFYVRNKKIITYDDFMETDTHTPEENTHNYKQTWQSIINLQKVGDDDDSIAEADDEADDDDKDEEDGSDNGSDNGSDSSEEENGGNTGYDSDGLPDIQIKKKFVKKYK